MPQNARPSSDPTPTPSSERPIDDGISVFSTLEAFKDGLTSTLSRAAAADVARGWAAKIEAADRPDLLGIRDGLRTLARQLDDQDAGGTTSTADIGRTMESLGSHTAETAETVGQAHLVEPLKRLGGYLKAAGIALAGGTHADQIAGVSTQTGPTPGDPELRSATAAPDVSGEASDPGRAGAQRSHHAVGDVPATPGDTTPGTTRNPQ